LRWRDNMRKLPLNDPFRQVYDAALTSKSQA
jgi:hypothetical protein